jgi:hypothetical protein
MRARAAAGKRNLVCRAGDPYRRDILAVIGGQESNSDRGGRRHTAALTPNAVEAAIGVGHDQAHAAGR